MEEKTMINPEEVEEQNLEDMPVDDFETYGEIIIPEQDPEVIDGIGAGGYTPRLTAPSNTDKNWIKTTAGGYNYCIEVTGGSCLPNCVG